MIFYTTTFLSSLTGAFNDPAVEQVGVLIGRADGTDYRINGMILAKNECCDSSSTFFVSNRQLSQLTARAHRQGEQVLGVIHSHPGQLPAVPSPADFDNCRHPVNAVFHPASSRLVFFDARGLAASSCLQQAARPARLAGLAPA